MSEAQDQKHIEETRNLSRYSVENAPISWLLVLLTVLFGVYGYQAMPKQKDPSIPVRAASVITAWPGATAHQVEQLVTRPIEETIAENSNIHPPKPTEFGIKSISLAGLSIVQVNLDESVTQPQIDFSDINLKLDELNHKLPQGAGPINFNSGFGNTAALMLTIASPLERDVIVDLRSEVVVEALERARFEYGVQGMRDRVSLVVMLPTKASISGLDRIMHVFADALETNSIGRGAQVIEGEAFIAVDVEIDGGKEALATYAKDWFGTVVGIGSYHPDAWQPVVVEDLNDLKAQLREAVGPSYTYRQLGDYADLVAQTLEGVHEVSTVLQSGLIKEQVFLVYSQERLVELGIPVDSITEALNSTNIVASGGTLSVGSNNVPVFPSGNFKSTEDIGRVVVTTEDNGAPVYLNSLGDVYSSYESPPRLLNFYTRQIEGKGWVRTPSVTLAVQMRKGEQISVFGEKVSQALEQLSDRLPEDLEMAKTSNQPRQVEENVALFVEALYEAIALVVLVAFIGFRDWRASLLLMISIPLTLAMSFGSAYLIGLDIQQVSVATLIIALGLLVDDPVVASDAIKRELVAGQPRGIAAWLGPTKLARAILFATLTNVIAYIPFVLLPGNTGDFLYSLPLMMACALISSRLVSMTFMPFLGFYILRAPVEAPPTIEERRSKGFTGWYYRVGQRAIQHRFLVLILVFILMLGGFGLGRGLKVSFFPTDVQYLFTIDVWAPLDTSVPTTAEITEHLDVLIRKTVEEAHANGTIDMGLQSISSFAGGGAPRFWQTLTPQVSQRYYGQIVVEMMDKQDTPILVPILQKVVSSELPGVWVDIKELQTNPLQYPVEIALAWKDSENSHWDGSEVELLRSLVFKLQQIIRTSPYVERARQDWYREHYSLNIDVDEDRAGMLGLSSRDVARSSQAALTGYGLSTFRDGRHNIPIVALLRPEERPQISNFGTLYVAGSKAQDGVPLSAIADVSLDLTTQLIRRQEHFPRVSVIGFPKPGFLASEVMDSIQDQLDEFESNLPPGISIIVGGEQAKATEGFGNLLEVLLISALGIFAALIFQFRNWVKPFIVLAGVPFGFAGGMTALAIMGASFSFMAFLGLVALVGVIVSHIIVLFDFIEEMHDKGEPLEQALLDAGIVRLRPVLITVGATVMALVPLAIHGGPLWKPLCYTQIGGLLVATVISLLIIPVIYSICVLDLKIIKWKGPVSKTAAEVE